MKFRSLPILREDQHGELAGKYITEKSIGLKVAAGHDTTPYGKGLADTTMKKMNQLGVTEVLYESIDRGTTNMSVFVDKMKSARIEVVYWGGTSVSVERGSVERVEFAT